MPDIIKIEPVEKEALTIVEVSQSIVIASDEDRESAATIGKGYKERIKFLGEYFDENIRKAHEIHKDLTSKKKALVDPFKSAIKILQASIGTYDHEKKEAARQAEIDRQKEETEKYQRALTIANNKIDKLLEGTQDKQTQLNTLNTMLEEGKLSEEEAEVVRGKVEIIEEAIQNNQDKVETVVAKVEEKAPVIAPIPKKVEPKNWTAEVVDVKALCQAIIDDKVPVGIIKTFDLVTIQKVRKLGQEYPGVRYTADHSKGNRL